MVQCGLGSADHVVSALGNDHAELPQVASHSVDPGGSSAQIALTDAVKRGHSLLVFRLHGHRVDGLVA